MNAKFVEEIHVSFDLAPGESMAEALFAVAQIAKSAATIQLGNLQPDVVEAQRQLLEMRQELAESRKLLAAERQALLPAPTRRNGHAAKR
jgi:hypothetical protein